MNKDYNFYENAPTNFALCFNTECASSGECLRRLAAGNLNKKHPCLTIINPLLTNICGRTSCPFFKEAKKVQVAYGFKEAMTQVPAGHVKNVRAAICKLVCKRNYYYLLRGEKPMFPDMQEKISRILMQNGLSISPKFDRYKWLYEW